MNRTEMREDYFKWICSLISNRVRGISYSKLLRYLFDTEFMYYLERDENRAIDGTDLRYRYGYEFNIPEEIIIANLDDRPCSVLEMIVALCHRIEEQIMYDYDLGDRTGTWFWGMIKNLGLDKMTNKNFDIHTTSTIVDCFLHREYEPNGYGGLVTINGIDKDMRKVEIWYQVMWYLTELYEKENG